MNVIKTLGGIVQQKFLDQKVPMAVTMAVTFRCTLRCKYCRIWKKAGEEMSTSQVMAAIDELAEAGTSRLGITGGEPLLRHDIGTIVARAKERNLFTTLFTNGTLVDQHMETLKQVDTVLLSLDGPVEIHDKMRGKGSHEAALRALELMSAKGIKVWTNTVVTNKNTHVVDYVLDLVKRHDAHAVFQPIFEHSYTIKGQDVEQLAAGRADYAALIDDLLARKRAGEPVFNSVPSLEFLREPVFEPEKRKCLASRAYCAVTPDGHVAPCQVLLQQEGLPDGRKVGFVEAFRRAHKPTPCHGCFCFATIEGDLLFNLDPPTVGNTVRYLAGEKLRRLRRAVLGARPVATASSGNGASRNECDLGACSCSSVDQDASAEELTATATTANETKDDPASVSSTKV